MFYVFFLVFLPKKILKTPKKYEKEKKTEFSISLIFFFVKKQNFVVFYEIWYFKDQKDEKLVRFWQVFGKNNF